MYKFKSKATGDLIMLGPNGDQLMRLIGREPALKGIIEVAAMADVIRQLEAAVAAEEAVRQAEGERDDSAAERKVGLRQRVWPMVEMLRRAERAGHPVVWGV